MRVCIEKNNPDSTRLREILSSSVIVLVGDSVEDGPAQGIGANEDSEKEQHLEGSQEQVNDTAFDQHNQSCPQQCDCHLFWMRRKGGYDEKLRMLVSAQYLGD